MTSSPGPMPSASSARCRPAVAELTANACRPGSPRNAAKSDSKRFVFGPVVSHPERNVSTTSAISSSPISGFAKGRNGWAAGMSGLREPRQHMGAQHRQAVQKSVERRMPAAHDAGERRSERHPRDLDGGVRKELANAPQRHAADV